MQSIKDLFIYMVIFLPLYAVIRFIFIKIRKKKVYIPREIIMAVLLIYCFALGLMLFRLDHAFGYLDAENRLAGIFPLSDNDHINYIPFKTINLFIQYANHFSLSTLVDNLIGNVLVFSPIGFGLALLWKKWQRFWKILLFGIFVPLTVEVIQYFVGRSADIDDIILNLIGVIIGYAIYLVIVLLSRLMPRLAE